MWAWLQAVELRVLPAVPRKERGLLVSGGLLPALHHPQDIAEGTLQGKGQGRDYYKDKEFP